MNKHEYKHIVRDIRTLAANDDINAAWRLINYYLIITPDVSFNYLPHFLFYANDAINKRHK